MRSILLLYLLVLHFSHSHFPICHSPTTLQIPRLTIKPNPNFRYSISNYANRATIIRNPNGTFLQGDFSTLTLISQKSEYEYISTMVSFKYPAQHMVAEVDNQVLELQVEYELNGKGKSGWKHKRIGLVVSFLLTEYAPEQTFSLGKQINSQLSNGSLFDLKAMLPLLPQLPMILYKGTHSSHPQDESFLWLVRKELLLMSLSQLQTVKSFIFSHLPREQLLHHGLLTRISQLNEIPQHLPLTIPVSP